MPDKQKGNLPNRDPQKDRMGTGNVKQGDTKIQHQQQPQRRGGEAGKFGQDRDDMEGSE